MSRPLSPAFWGALLIVVGVLALLSTLGVLGLAEAVVWAVVFLGVAIGFLYVYLTREEHWWAVIPGLTALGIASTIALDALAPALQGKLGGPLVVGAIAISFLAIYLRNRAFWWALIPGGVMASVTLVTVVEALGLPIDGGAIVLLGIGATFLILSTVSTQKGERLRWALIPGGIMLLIGLFVAAEGATLAQYVLPAALLVAGLLFILRSARAKE